MVGFPSVSFELNYYSSVFSIEISLLQLMYVSKIQYVGYSDGCKQVPALLHAHHEYVLLAKMTWWLPAFPQTKVSLHIEVGRQFGYERLTLITDIIET